jgi:ABC-type glycerol-3-phosphate transport system substrate-binding protein
MNWAKGIGMASSRLSRREFLRLSAAASGAGLLAACAPELPVVGLDPTEEPGADDSGTAIAEGEVELILWYQGSESGKSRWDPMIERLTELHPEAHVTLKPTGYGQLRDDLLPAIAAGREGDVNSLYTDWVVGIDISQVLLDITDQVGGLSALEDAYWPSSFSAVDAPEGKVYYLPFMAGINGGGAITINTAFAAQHDIDYLGIQLYEELVEAGKTLTKRGISGSMVRAGYSPFNSQYDLLKSFIWQLGGEFYHRDRGVFSFSSSEGEAAAQVIYDVYWEHETCDFELFEGRGEYDAYDRGLIAIQGQGAWSASYHIASNRIPSDNIPLPKLANAVEYVLYPGHIGCWGLSKRLPQAPDKLAIALDFLTVITSPDYIISRFEDYSGTCPVKAVYEDPRIEEVEFGPMSKRIAQAVWPIGRYPQDLVADQGPAFGELERAMRGEISIRDALLNMDTYLQRQEDQARERLRG